MTNWKEKIEKAEKSGDYEAMIQIGREMIEEQSKELLEFHKKLVFAENKKSDTLDNMKFPTEKDMFEGYLLKFKNEKQIGGHLMKPTKNYLITRSQAFALFGFKDVLIKHADVESIASLDYETYKELKAKNDICDFEEQIKNRMLRFG